MRAVHDDGQALRSRFKIKALHASRQTRGEARVLIEKRRADRLARAPAHPLAAKLAEDGGGKREIDRVDRRRGGDARALDARPKFAGARLQDTPRFVIGAKRRDEHGPGLQDPNLLARDRRARMPQDLRMLERDIGHDGDFAVDDVGRIEPPAEAHFDHRPLEGGFAEDEKGCGGEKVEPGCVGRGRACGARSLVAVERAIQGSRERRLVDIAALNAHPLGDAFDVRGRVTADTKAGMRQSRLDQGRDRPLAFGARDMDRAEGLLRVAETPGQILHRLEADAHRVARPALPVGERVEAGLRLCEVTILGHRAVIPKSWPLPKAGAVALPHFYSRNRLAPSGARRLWRTEENEARPYSQFPSQRRCPKDAAGRARNRQKLAAGVGWGERWTISQIGRLPRL